MKVQKDEMGEEVIRNDTKAGDWYSDNRMNFGCNNSPSRFCVVALGARRLLLLNWFAIDVYTDRFVCLHADARALVLLGNVLKSDLDGWMTEAARTRHAKSERNVDIAPGSVLKAVIAP